MSRLRWLVLPVVSVVAWRVALWFYWLPERKAFLARGGDTSAVAYGEGRLDAQAFVTSSWIWPTALVLALIFVPPRTWQIALIAIAAVALSVGIDRALGNAIYEAFGPTVRMRGVPVLSALLLLLAFQYLKRAGVLTRGSEAS